MVDTHQHWEQVYQTKPADTVSWYQRHPQTSLQYILESRVPLEGIGGFSIAATLARLLS